MCADMRHAPRAPREHAKVSGEISGWISSDI
jgi:hypothetical protein